jgi:hypothetical protein
VDGTALQPAALDTLTGSGYGLDNSLDAVQQQQLSRAGAHPLSGNCLTIRLLCLNECGRGNDSNAVQQRLSRAGAHPLSGNCLTIRLLCLNECGRGNDSDAVQQQRCRAGAHPL